MKRDQIKIDYRLAAIIAAMVLFGLVMLASAGAVTGFKRFDDAYYFLKTQLRGLVVGLCFFYFFYRLHYLKLKTIAMPFLAGSILLLILVLIPGIGSDYGTGSRSWINLGFLSVQPSEIIKLSFLIYLAAWLGREENKITGSFVYELLPFLGLLGLIMALIVLQPDLGTLSIIIILAMSVYFMSGAKWRYLLGLIVVGIIIFIALIKVAPYRMDRFTAFINPEIDPKGISYHTRQALIAVGSGGIFGRGYGQSRQKFEYLPEVTGDSIFAIISEEGGLLLDLFFLSLLASLAIIGLKISSRAPDKFGRLLAIGIVSWILFQSFINIGAMVAIMPITGIPLPFVSFGGTALMINLAAAGILVNISKYSRL